jgi:endonuclease/exonuclease/phosphatase family metal-dependent hydrolase
VAWIVTASGLLFQLGCLTLRSWSGLWSLAAGFLPFTVLLVAVSVVAAAQMRSRWMGFGAAGMLTVLLVIYGPQFLPAADALSERGLLIATANVEDIDDGPLPSSDLETFARQLEAEAPDIVLLQEISRDAFEWLHERLADSFPHGCVAATTFPKAILSAHPISDTRDVGPSPWGPVAVGGNVFFEGETLLVLSVHLQPAPGIAVMSPLRLDEMLRDAMYHKRKQIAAIAAAGGRSSVIAGGDFNLTPESFEYSLIRDHWNDSHRGAGGGLGFTWPTNPVVPPLFRIDYIFSSPDHRMVLARIQARERI